MTTVKKYYKSSFLYSISLAVFLSLFAPLCSLFGQVIMDFKNVSILYGDLYKSGVYVEGFTELENGNLVGTQIKREPFKLLSRKVDAYMFSTLIPGNEIKKRKPIKFYGNGKHTNLLTYGAIGNQIICISIRGSLLNRTPKIYFHYIDPEIPTKNDHGFELPGFVGINKSLDDARMFMISEDSREYASFLYFPHTEKNQVTSVRTAVFKKGEPFPTPYEFIFPYATEDFKPLDFFVQDDSLQILVAGHFYKQDRKERKSEANRGIYDKLTLNSIIGREIKTTEISEENIHFSHVLTEQLNHDIYIMALCTSATEGNLSGVYSAKITKNGIVEVSNFSAFSTQTLSILEDEINSNFPNRNRYDTEYSGFTILDFTKTEDGFIGVAEYNAMEYRYSTAGGPGVGSVIDAYYWSGNLLIFKINSEGEVTWTKIIPKIQNSINDQGYYLSTLSHIDKEKVYLFFNDNINNYEADGYVNNRQIRPKPANLGPIKNTIAGIIIDTQNGEYIQQKTIGRTESNVLLVPKMSMPLNEKNQLFIYGRNGNRYRTGKITIGE